ncbi:MAG: hypothetical protein IJS05_06230 [Paludibacteraceae bacterium]|nr:hypothetical protein [Paludibacteraceae bacterium]
MLSSEVEKAVGMYHEASKQQQAGNIGLSHSIYREAADIFIDANEAAWASVCYYSLAISYLNQRDTAGMDEALSRLEQLRQKHPDDISIHFDYYSVLATRLVVDYENCTDTDSAALVRKQMMSYQKKAASYLEQMSREERHKRHVHPVWTYYNIAVMYDLYYDPVVIDSVRKYLDLAQEARDHTDYLAPIDLQEADISILDERSWLAYYFGERAEAKRYMLEVLALIDTVSQTRPNAVLTERCEAYQFMAMIAEEENNHTEALEWQKKLNEANRERYNVEQNEALHEVEAQYKKREQDQTISALRKQNIMLIAISASLLAILVSAFVIFRLRRKNREQEQYEQAVEAALPQTIAQATANESVQPQHPLHESAADQPSSTRPIEASSLKLQLDLLCHDFPRYEQRLRKVNLTLVADLCSHARKPLSVVDLRYLICFLTDLTTTEVAEMFSVEPPSIYIARYRLRRKFPDNYKLPI